MGSELAIPVRQLEHSEVPTPERFELYTRKRREQIIAALTPKGGEPTGSFLPDAARHAGIPPKLLKAWVSHGEQYPKGPLGRFSREVNRIIAEGNDQIRKDIHETAKGKKWEGLARIGEQYDPETWSRPSEKSGVNIGTLNIIDKLNQVHAEMGNPLTTGD